jgi:SAM-dependent methyltransferase
MLFDSQDLVAFYESPLGQVTRRDIYRRLRMFWPDLRGQRLLGYGFAVPYLRGLALDAERAIALMPSQHGPVRWPERQPSSLVAEEDALPFPDGLFDRVLMVHGLESADSTRLLMRQIWRALAPAGRLLIVAPNRLSLWAQVDRSPFAQGRPFNRLQLTKLLQETLFAPERWDSALLLPPLKGRRLIGRGIGWEKTGQFLWPRLAGVHLVEASKSLYAPVPVAVRRPKGTLIPAPA